MAAQAGHRSPAEMEGSSWATCGIRSRTWASVERDGEFVIARGEGAYVFDADGNRYLDATAGLWFTNVGHGRAELAEAAAEQMSRLAAYSTFGDYATEPTIDAGRQARRDRAGAGQQGVLHLRRLGLRRHRRQARPPLLGRGRTTRAHRDRSAGEKAYHGMHYAGTALSGIPGNREGYGELVADSATVAWDSADDLRATIERVGPDRVAAFFCEPVIGAGGVYPPPEGYLADVRKVCTEYDVLFVADEVVTGYGRIGGSWFASTPIRPRARHGDDRQGSDVGLPADGRGARRRPRCSEPFFRPDGGVWWRHGYTYSGHAAAAAVALANLDDHRARGPARRGRSARDDARPRAVAAGRARAGRRRCAAASARSPPSSWPTPARRWRFAKTLRSHGVATRAVGAGGIQISPAFVMTDDQVAELAAAVAAALDA